MTKKLKIAFQGEPGANSHIAIVEAYPDAEPLPCATFEDALGAISGGEADLGMIPIENSVAGRVAEIHQLLPVQVERGLRAQDALHRRVDLLERNLA